MRQLFNGSGGKWKGGSQEVLATCGGCASDCAFTYYSKEITFKHLCCSNIDRCASALLALSFFSICPFLLLSIHFSLVLLLDLGFACLFLTFSPCQLSYLVKNTPQHTSGLFKSSCLTLHHTWLYIFKLCTCDPLCLPHDWQVFRVFFPTIRSLYGTMCHLLLTLMHTVSGWSTVKPGSVSIFSSAGSGLHSVNRWTSSPALWPSAVSSPSVFLLSNLSIGFTNEII